MKILLSILTLLVTYTASAQFALIKDEEGYVNVRSTPERGNNIMDTIHNESIVAVGDREGNWYMVGYKRDWGYVYHTKLAFLNTLGNIPVYKETDNTITFRNNEISITLSKERFIPSKHKLSYYKKSDQLIKIDGRDIYGKDGAVPESQYGSVSITLKGKKVILPKQEISDLFQPTLGHTECSYDREKGILYISSSNGDGAGYYTVLWIFKNGKFLRREVFTS